MTRSNNDKPRATKPRAWQRMLSGRRLDLLNPSPVDVEIEDIAHGLARVARWNGQTVGNHALSVAQHSVIVEHIADVLNQGPQNQRPDHQGANWGPQQRLAALLHDAAEYVVGDLISPFKAALGLDYKSFELSLMQAIHLRFGLPGRLSQADEARIKQADRVAAYYEATVLAGFETEEAQRFFGPIDTIPDHIAEELKRLTPESTDIAQQQFLSRFRYLRSQLDDAALPTR
jgi:5'-deoxynucleotidase YfbR-like HD superfamily hydrolase